MLKISLESHNTLSLNKLQSMLDLHDLSKHRNRFHLIKILLSCQICMQCPLQFQHLRLAHCRRRVRDTIFLKINEAILCCPLKNLLNLNKLTWKINLYPINVCLLNVWLDIRIRISADFYILNMQIPANLLDLLCVVSRRSSKR